MSIKESENMHKTQREVDISIVDDDVMFEDGHHCRIKIFNTFNCIQQQQ